MNQSKEFLKKEGLYPRINFKEERAPVTIVFGKGVMKQFEDLEGNTVNRMVYTIRDRRDGEIKQIITSSPRLVQALLSAKSGDVFEIQLKSVKTPQGYRSNYQVKQLNEEDEENTGEVDQAEINPADVPVEDEESL